MNISYNDRSDVLYLRLDDKKQDVINQRVSENVVLDLGDGDRIVGIEILDASKSVNLNKLLPVHFSTQHAPA